jgi:hypothetical protein
MTANPDEAEFDRVYQALKAHKAVCAACQKEDEEWVARTGRLGQIPILLLSDITDVAIEEMKADGFDISKIGLDSTNLFHGMQYIIRVLQDWKLITWNESMLHVREEWAMREDD